jgi:hypothetical protein
LEALAETFFPAEGTNMPTVQEVEVVEYFDDLLVHLPLKERLLIRGLLVLLEVQSVALSGLRPKLFTQATFAERTKNIAGWEQSGIFQRRLVFMAIRTLLLWAYADSQETEHAMGFVNGTDRTKARQVEFRSITQRTLQELSIGQASDSTGETT